MTPAVVKNPYEAKARQAKAYELADLFTANGATAAEAQVATDEEWEVLAAEIGRSKLPSRDTIDLVIEILVKRENAAADQPDDPFFGFPADGLVGGH